MDIGHRAGANFAEAFPGLYFTAFFGVAKARRESLSPEA